MVTCTECGKEFETENQLKGHMMHHKKEGRGRVSATDRKKRVPLGAPRQKLTAEEATGKVRRWVNDHPGRLENARNGGYEFVSDSFVGEDVQDGNSDLGTRVSRVVGKNEDGTPLRAYLMEIDTDLYEADQKEKQREVDKVDAAIKSGKVDNTLNQHGYVDQIEYNP